MSFRRHWEACDGLGEEGREEGRKNKLDQFWLETASEKNRQVIGISYHFKGVQEGPVPPLPWLRPADLLLRLPAAHTEVPPSLRALQQVWREVQASRGEAAAGRVPGFQGGQQQGGGWKNSSELAGIFFR